MLINCIEICLTQNGDYKYVIIYILIIHLLNIKEDKAWKHGRQVKEGDKLREQLNPLIDFDKWILWKKMNVRS